MFLAIMSKSLENFWKIKKIKPRIEMNPIASKVTETTVNGDTVEDQVEVAGVLGVVVVIEMGEVDVFGGVGAVFEVVE